MYRILLLLIIATTIHADFYEEGDWVTYGDFRYVTAILPVRDRVFIATTNGILRYDSRFDQWEYPYTSSTGMPQGIFVLRGYDDFGDVLWISTPDSSVYRHKAVFKRWEKEYTPDSWGTEPDLTLPETMPAYMMNDGMKMFDPARKAVEDRLFRKYPVTVTAQTDRNDSWIGFHGLGIGTVRNGSRRLETVRYGLNRYGAETVMRDPVDGTFWIGGIRPEQNGGITRWNPGKDEWTHYDADYLDRVDHDEVHDMATDERHVWFATDGGLLRWSRNDESFRMLTDFDGISHVQVRALAIDGDTLWAGTKRGITCISLKSGLITEQEGRMLRYVEVYDMAAAGGRAYAATDNGLLVYRRSADSGGKWESVRDPAGRIPYECRTLYAEGNDVWCGGRNLLAVYHADESRWEYEHDPQTVIYTIAADSVNMWMGTSGGVIKHLRGTGMRKTLTVKDGLPHPSVHSIVLGDEYAWFGTGKGMVRYKWKAMHRTD